MRDRLHDWWVLACVAFTLIATVLRHARRSQRRRRRVAAWW